jgi:hypothetical protein
MTVNRSIEILERPGAYAVTFSVLTDFGVGTKNTAVLGLPRDYIHRIYYDWRNSDRQTKGALGEICVYGNRACH